MQKRVMLVRHRLRFGIESITVVCVVVFFVICARHTTVRFRRTCSRIPLATKFDCVSLVIICVHNLPVLTR